MFETLKKVWKITDLRKRILFIAALLVIFRIAAHIPIPGVNADALQQLFTQNQVLGLVNVFSGGALANFSIVMMGVGPYITSSIIFQVLQMVIPQLEEMQKEGASGQQKINQYTRLLAIPLAVLQGYGTISILQKTSGNTILQAMSVGDWVVALVTVTAGSIFLMWLGELITEKQLGNGVSLIIFAGIVSSLPTSIQQVALTFDSSQIPSLLGFLLAAFVTIVGVVFITEGQRNIPIAHARHHQATKQKSYLPMRVNQAGVIPIIFAVTLVTIPPLAAQYLLQLNVGFLNGPMQWLLTHFQSQGAVYAATYFVLVVLFSYFYTSVVFKPHQIAENLQKGGSFIPGIRPGEDTESYLNMVSNRILLAGALFLGVIAILPIAVQWVTTGGLQNIGIGGTSLLIVVSVALETVKQLEAQLTLREYDAL